MRDDAPLLHRILQYDHDARDGVELARRLEQHVTHETVQVRFPGEALKVALDDGVGLGELGDALFGGALAFTAHVIDEAFAVQRGADHAGRGLERRKFGGVDRTVLARVVESHHADELTGDEDRHDGLALGADALDARGAPVRAALAEAHAAPGAQLRAHGGKFALVAGAQRNVAQVRGHPFGGPLAHHDQQRLTLRAGAGLHEIHAIDVRGLTDQSQDPGDRRAHIGRLQQQAAGARRGGEEPLARLQ